MSTSSNQTALDLMIAKFPIIVEQAWHDFNIWVSRLSDTEQLFIMGVFILLLFMLILVSAGRRKTKPRTGKQFFNSVLMVVIFSFAAGWMIDSRFDLTELMRHLRLA